MSNLFDNLLISSPNGGGLFFVSDGKVFRLDSLDTTGLSADGVRVLRGIQPDKLFIYKNGVKEITQRSVAFHDIHDVFSDGEFIYLVGTSGNEIIKLNTTGEELQRWVWPGEKDALHINCLGKWNGRIVFSAFGKFKEHRGYKGKSKKSGFVQDLHTGDRLIDGLSQPHSLVPIGSNLLLANSENQEICEYDPTGNLIRTLVLDGYTRGICIVGNVIYVGLSCSRNIDITGVSTATVVAIDLYTWQELGRIHIPANEIYAIQTLSAGKDVVDVLATIAATTSSRLTATINELEGQIASLNQALSERDGQIDNLNNQIRKIMRSTSWRITSPVRVTKNLFISPKRTVYSLIRSFFWKLPDGVRNALQSPRYKFVSFVKRVPSLHSKSSSKLSPSDLSWREFSEKVLCHRKKYKGIFIQELTIDWNVPLFQRPQHISTALGRLGYLVIYRTDNWAGDNVNGFRKVSKNVWITNIDEVENIQGVVRSFYSTAYSITPDQLMKNGKRGILVYEYIDHIDSEISGGHENIQRLLTLKKFAFSGEADFIVASAKKLYNECVEAVGSKKVILVPNGVDTLHYRNHAHLKTPIPETLCVFKKVHKAIVGYFGAIAPWLWYEAIEQLARKRRELGFVFIGPDYYGGSRNLPKTDNLLNLGTVDYKVLPAYARQFDICFIPFKPGNIAKTTSPLKLFEYFALEKPVVVTKDMDECTAYTEVFRGSTLDELSDAIDTALLVKDQESFKARLRELADQNDWSKRALAYENFFIINSGSSPDY